MSTNFKLYFNDDDIRRIRLEVSTWESFRAKLQQLYPEYSTELAVRYRDEEGDLITITTAREWNTMLEALRSTTPIKLYLQESSAQANVKVSVVEAEPETKVEESIPETIPEVVTEQEEAIAEETQQIEEGEKELGFEMLQVPAQTSEAPICVTELDQVYVFLEKLRQQACSLLNPAENETLKKGKDFVQSLIPEENPPIVQELAGVVDSVKRALSDGYTNLKDMPEFKELLDFLSGAPETPDPKKWESQQETLASMGFIDREANEALLIKHKGNLQQVINALLE